MNTKIAGVVLACLFLLNTYLTDAQQPGKVPRIGYLSLRAGIEPREEQFQRGLRELGYIEGQNIVIEWRFAEGKEGRLPGFAAEMVRLKVDVIVAAGAQAARAAKQATTSIPIVIGQVGDPVQQGFVVSLARPGGNITGVSSYANSSDLAGKKMALLKEAIPDISRVGFLQDPRNPGHTLMLRETEAAARTLGVQVQNLEVQRPDDLDNAFQTALNWGAAAIIEQAGAVLGSKQDRDRIATLEIKTRLPVLHNEQASVLAGGFMSYAMDIPAQFHRAATYIDKILKGSKPADMPIEEPTKFELVINLNTAKQIGLTIPQSVLNRADKVIK